MKLFQCIKQNKYIKRTIHIIFLLATVAVIDLALGNLLENFYFKQKSGWLYRTTYALNETTADLVIIGSSRANHHYHPEVLSKSLNLTYYNAGRDGSYIFYHYAVIRSILKRYKPKVIIFDFIKTGFKPSQESYDRTAYLLPYYRSHPELRDIIETKSPFEKIKLLSRIYPYNSMLVTIAAGHPALHSTRDGDNKGFIPLLDKWNEPLVSYKASPCYDFDKEEVRIYESILRDCLKSGTTIYVVVSPYFHKLATPDCSVIEARKIAAQYNVPFLDFGDSEYFRERPHLFYDSYHLNENGARVFSEQLVEAIKREESRTYTSESNLDQ